MPAAPAPMTMTSHDAVTGFIPTRIAYAATKRKPVYWVVSAACSASLFMTMMLMRRLLGFSGLLASNNADEESPTTRMIFEASMPPEISSWREALARSMESSQLL